MSERAPESLWSDWDYVADDGVCGVHTHKKYASGYAPDFPPIQYTRTDLVQSQIDAAVAAAYEDAAEMAAYCLANPEGENLEDRQYAIKYRILARGDTDALEAYRRQVRAEALREAAKTAEHFYEKGQVTKPSDILALIPDTD